MFQAIRNATVTPIAHSAIADVTCLPEFVLQLDSCESFWMAETLKYFYLVFSEPGVVSLDEWVL
jgi:mannosyl-oligosaccharide alpha-1,2-mannosidase